MERAVLGTAKLLVDIRRTLIRVLSAKSPNRAKERTVNAHEIATQLCIQARVPVFLWGGPGIGKTAVLESIATTLKEPLHTVILSIREPADQGGLPWIVNEKGERIADGATSVLDVGVKMVPPMWARQLVKDGHGVVFWDEFNTAPPTTQSSALRVIHGGYAGDLPLPGQTSHVAAGNPATQVAGGYDLTAAIANRWTHIPWPMDPAAWCNGMVSGWPTPEVLRLPEDWRTSLPAKRGLVSAFIRRRPELLYVLPKAARDQGRAWPSPRQWDRIAHLLAAVASVKLDEKSEVAKVLIDGCVGEAAGEEFVKWFTELDLRDPEEYLADPMGTPLPTRQDQTMATLDSVAAAALDKSRPIKDQATRYRAAWKVMGRMIRSGKGDVGIPAMRVLCKGIPKELKRDLPPEIEEVLPMLEKAGIDFGAQAA